MYFKRIVLFVLAVLISASAYAVPAWPGTFQYKQPDGTIINLQLHGDEFFAWTTIAGTKTVVTLDEKGFWRPSALDVSARKAAWQRRAAINRGRAPHRTQGKANPMTHGERHIPVLLVSFPDVPFSIESPLQQFTAMLNEKGYSANGGTGSVRDYYVDNSHGEFKPVFDVYGPVELPNEIAYYGAPSGKDVDSRPGLALYHAALALDNAIDFSKYDYDSDGIIDMTLFYYAGYSQAEGGSDDSIWPHQGYVFGEAANTLFDGKKFGAYFCTSELKGRSGTKMCGIGSTCHEFAHSLGLPDFYDVDYEDNGYTGGLYQFSLMCNGCYNNGSCTPPYLNAEERIMLGWMSEDDVRDLPEGPVEFPSVNNNVSYKTLTDIEGEYFLYECRDGQGWDAPLPSGMVVYHVDKSEVRDVGGLTPYDQWSKWMWYNSVNCYGDHPCFYVVPSTSQKSLDFSGQPSAMVFPGQRAVTSYKPIDWDGNNTGVSISGINYGSGIVRLSTSYSVRRRITGSVSDQYGQPVSGVYVVMSKPSPAGASPRKALRKSSGGRYFEALTGSDGKFEIALDGFEGDAGHLTFSKSGFTTSGTDVTLNPRITRISFSMTRVGENEIINYSWYDASGDMFVSGGESSNSQMAAIRIPANILPSAGGSLLSVDVYVQWQAKEHYIVVDSGSERILTHRIDRPKVGAFNRVDFKDLDVAFDSGQDLYVGYAVRDAQVYVGYDGYVFVVTSGSSNCYYSTFDLDSSNWEPEEDSFALALSASVMPKSTGPGPVEPEVNTLADMGFSSIADPGNGKYKAGDAFPLELNPAPGVPADSVTWTFDGADVTGAKSVSLSPGTHTVSATITLPDGSIEFLELVLECQ